MGQLGHRVQEIDRGVEADAVRDRLRALPLVRACDRPAVETALAAHLRGLGLAPRPVRWIEAADATAAARAGFLAFWAVTHRRGHPEVPGTSRTLTRDALVGTDLRVKGLVGPALRVEKLLPPEVRAACRHAPYGLLDAFSGEKADRLDLDVVGECAGVDRAMAAARSALAAKGIYQRLGVIPTQGASTPPQGSLEVRQEVQIGSAPAHALAAAGWLARAHVLSAAGADPTAHERVARTLLPLVDAVEAGLWLFWVLPDEVLAVAAPER